MLTFEERDDEYFGARVNGQLEGTLEFHDGAHMHVGPDRAGWFFYPPEGFRVRLCGVEHHVDVAKLLVEAFLRGRGLL